MYTSCAYICTHTHREKVNGYTALMMAALEGDEIIVDILIACVSVAATLHMHLIRYIHTHTHTCRELIYSRKVLMASPLALWLSTTTMSVL